MPDSGTATLDGRLTVTVTGGYVPPHDSTFEVLVADSVSGTFAEVEFVDLPAGLTATVESGADRVTVRFSDCAEVVFGDFNCDTLVDVDDYALFAPCLAGPQATPPAGCADKDLDNDGDTDLADAALLMAAFGG